MRFYRMNRIYGDYVFPHRQRRIIANTEKLLCHAFIGKWSTKLSAKCIEHKALSMIQTNWKKRKESGIKSKCECIDLSRKKFQGKKNEKKKRPKTELSKSLVAGALLGKISYMLVAFFCPFIYFFLPFSSVVRTVMASVRSGKRSGAKKKHRDNKMKNRVHTWPHFCI